MDEGSARKALRQFGIRAKGVRQVQSRSDRVVWRVTAAHDEYALKWLDLPGKGHKIAAVNEFLRRNGIAAAPVLPGVDGKPLVYHNRGCFLLFPWLSARSPHYDEDPGMLARISALAAQFHQASRGYVAAGGPLWGTLLNWPRDYARELGGLERFGERAASRNDKFSRLFRGQYPWLRSRATWAIHRLSHTAFDSLVQAAYRDPILGHGDYSRANLLLDDKGNLTIVDLDTVGIALPVSDLSRLIPLVDHDLQNWSDARFRVVLDSYERIRPIPAAELELLFVDLIFPYQALRLAKSYYEHKWGSPAATLLEELERCIRTDHEKLVSLGVGPR